MYTFLKYFKWILYVLVIAICALFFVPIFYAEPTIDDFNILANAIEHSKCMNVFAYALSAMKGDYLNWQGTYFAVFIESFLHVFIKRGNWDTRIAFGVCNNSYSSNLYIQQDGS